MHKPIIVSLFLIVGISACSLAPEDTPNKTYPENMSSKVDTESISWKSTPSWDTTIMTPIEQTSSSGAEVQSENIEKQTPAPQEIRSITYSNPHYNIQFDYPSDFTLESHSWVAGWYESGKVDLDDYLSFSWSRGSFSIILPDHTAPFGTAPIHTRKDETITLWNRKVLKHIEFWSNDNPGPNAQWSWILEYTIDIDGKKYKFQTWEYGTFSTYSIPEEVDTIIQDIIKSIK